MVGVAGPLIDSFFVRSGLDRRSIVGTKAVIQTLSHLLKVAFYGGSVIADVSVGAASLALLIVAAGIAVLGTLIGGRILGRLSDRTFLTLTRWLITGAGAWFALRGAADLIGRA